MSLYLVIYFDDLCNTVHFECTLRMFDFKSE